jgi:hypothetical protein
MNFLQRRRARMLIERAQPFADEELVAVANFTWVGNSMGAQPGPTRLFVIATTHMSPDKGTALIGGCRWPRRD